MDVSVKETSICITDETGKICRELKLPSHPEDLLRVLQGPALNLEQAPGLKRHKIRELKKAAYNPEHVWCEGDSQDGTARDPLAKLRKFALCRRSPVIVA